MKNKIFSHGLFALFVLILVSGLASATDCLKLTEITVPENVNHAEGSLTVIFSVSNTELSCSTTKTGINWEITSNKAGEWTLPTLDSLAYGDTEELSAVFTFDSYQSGIITTTVELAGHDSETETLDISAITILDDSALMITPSGTLSEISNGEVVVTNEGNVPLDVDLSEVSVFGVVFSEDTITNLLPGEDSEVIEVSLPLDVVLEFGNNVIEIMAEDDAEEVSDTAVFTIEKGFCEVGEIGGNLEITDISFDNTGEGDDEEWKLLDVIEVEVEVENTGDIDVEDVTVELALFDSDGKDQSGDLEFENTDEEKIEIGDLDEDDDEETVTFKFKVPADFEDGNYKLAIKAYGDKEGEDVECTSVSSDLSDDFFEDISVDREDDEGKFIAFDDAEFLPSDATCGERVTMSLDVYNIGDEEQDQVKVILRNTELDIEETLEIRNDMKEGDKESVSFEFTIPQGLDDKFYQFKLSAEYDYKRGTYRESSDEETVFLLRVAGCSGGNTGGVSGDKFAVINAVLDSDAEAGEKLVVRATITNLNSGSSTFVLDASGYQSWASLDEVSQRILDLDAGESRDVVFTFDVDGDADGEESFTVEIRDEDGATESREIVVNIESPSTGGPSISGLGDNAYLWIIGIVNVVLVILIIIVAVRVARR